MKGKQSTEQQIQQQEDRKLRNESKKKRKGKRKRTRKKVNDSCSLYFRNPEKFSAQMMRRLRVLPLFNGILPRSTSLLGVFVDICDLLRSLICVHPYFFSFFPLLLLFFVK